MQKFIAKYGLAAHLAILAVAPLFLFPFYGEETVAVVLLWLSLPAAAWIFMQPSVRRGEMLHNSRQRVASEVFRDPIFWVMLVVVACCGLRALNSGIAMVYDAETASWQMASPEFPLMPASVGTSGFLPFAASVACMVLLIGCRNALGRSARQAYFLISSVLAGLAAVMAVVLANLGNELASHAMTCPHQELSYVGVAFAVHFVSGLIAVVAVIENKWNRVMPLLILAVGGTAVGAYAFSPAYVSGIGLAAWLVLFAYSFFYALRILRNASEFKMILVLGVSLLSAWALVAMTMPQSVCHARATSICECAFFPDWYAAARKTLSDLALKVWMTNSWTGTGVGSFGLDIRFNAVPADWASIPRGLVAPPFGWLKLLVERGIFGAALMAVPLILLLATYMWRLVGWLLVRTPPQPGCWMALPVLLAVVAMGCFDCSYLRADVMMAVAGILALSASSFPKAAKGGKNG